MFKRALITTRKKKNMEKIITFENNRCQCYSNTIVSCIMYLLIFVLFVYFRLKLILKKEEKIAEFIEIFINTYLLISYRIGSSNIVNYNAFDPIF